MSRRIFTWSSLTLACALVGLIPDSAAAQLRAVPYITGLSLPIDFEQDPSNPALQYVVQQKGLIRVISNGVLQGAPFLDLSAKISQDGGERGLLGLAFPPDYAATRRFYVYYTRAADGNIVVARYQRSLASVLVADPATEKRLTWIPTGQDSIEHSTFGNHNGGRLAFGPDGYLYVGTGDGGGGDDSLRNAQNPNALLGKILRIDVSVPDGNTNGYAVPPTNPFAGGTSPLKEIWALGIRNPWKFSFDDTAGGTRALVIADVGQGSWEEIDYEPTLRGGRNYGWPRYEGTHDEVTSVTPYSPVTNPIFEYDHNTGNSITGGYVYRGRELRETFRGRYFYADFVRGRVWSIGLTVDGAGAATAARLIEHTAEFGGSSALGAISSFGRDSLGEIYVVSYAGTIFKIIDPGNVQTLPFNFNGDAFKDVLLYNWSSGAWKIEIGNAQGGFDEGMSGTAPAGVRIYVADFNGDGLDDLFIYSPRGGQYFKHINTGGSFAAPFSEGWQTGFDVFIADLNADGKSDVFVYNPQNGVWFTCISTGSGTAGFTYGTDQWAPIWTITPGDFNGDGRTDFLLYDRWGGLYYKAISNGAGGFTYPASGVWAPGWTPTVADLNGDGRADVFLYNASSGYWYQAISTGTGTGGFTYTFGTWAPGWTVQTANFDGNASVDLFLYDPVTTGVWYKVINNGGTFSYFSGAWASWVTQVVDLDGNSRTDVFLFDTGSRTWYRALTTTPGAFTYQVGSFP